MSAGVWVSQHNLHFVFSVCRSCFRMINIWVFFLPKAIGFQQLSYHTQTFTHKKIFSQNGFSLEDKEVRTVFAPEGQILQIKTIFDHEKNTLENYLDMWIFVIRTLRIPKIFRRVQYFHNYVINIRSYEIRADTLWFTFCSRHKKVHQCLFILYDVRHSLEIFLEIYFWLWIIF